MRRSTSPMIVRLHEIPPEGLRLGYTLGDEWMHAALAETELRDAAVVLQAEAFLTRTNEQVFAKGTVQGDVTVPCSRCAGAARVGIDAPFQMVYLPEGEAGEELEPDEERELSGDDADFSTYVEDEIDLGATFREQLLLALPLAPLCREDCKGLCGRCGKDLNEGPCGCPPEAPLPGAGGLREALKNVKL